MKLLLSSLVFLSGFRLFEFYTCPNENEDNWIKAINNILNDIQFALDNGQDIQATIRDIRYKYYLINSGNGSFTDFYICRDNLNERVEANKVLEEVKSNIVDLLDW